VVDEKWGLPSRYGSGTFEVQQRPSYSGASVRNASYSSSAPSPDAGIYTLDFVVPAGKGKEPHRLKHEFGFPKHINSGLAYLETSKVLYHGSDWLEIDDIVSQGCSILGSKIFTSALKPGMMNELRWDLMFTAMCNARYSWIEVINPRPREGHFKMSLMGKWSIP